METSCKIFSVLFLVIGLFVAVHSEPKNITRERNGECGSLGAENLKITIFSRKNRTGQIYAQVKLEEGLENKNSWQIDIDHDSCRSCSDGSNGKRSGSSVDVIGGPEAPGPLYELVQGLGYYKFHNRGKNWNDAKLTCENEGAHLAIINSQQEADLLVELHSRLPNTDTYNFVGASDMDMDGTWVTVFDELLTETGFSVWNTGEPDRSNGENCLGLNIQVVKFHALHCNDVFGFFCEREL